MRMWMVDPCGMCRRHLLGEHVECHMIAGSLIKGRRLDGFVDNNCLEIRSLGRRHLALSQEMVKRGYKHQSPLPRVAIVSGRRSGLKVFHSRVDRAAALAELHRRCPECRALAKNISK